MADSTKNLEAVAIEDEALEQITGGVRRCSPGKVEEKICPKCGRPVTSLIHLEECEGDSAAKTNVIMKA